MKLKNVVSAILPIALLLATLAAFVPFSPPMPEVTDSEKFAMNYAASQGMVVGKDVIYTYGPYSSIYSGQYFPDTDFRMVVCCLYLAFSFWVPLALLLKNVDWRWTLTLFLALSGLIYFRDVLLLAIPFLVGLSIFKELATKDKQGWLQNKYAPLLIAILFAPFGLLPLTKGTILFTCAAVSAFCAVVLFVSRHKALAIICLVAPTISMLLFWIASGQSIKNLPIYFISMQGTISGYSNAMSVVGQPVEVIRYLISALLLLASIYFQRNLKYKALLIGLYLIFLFISFKGGFVRHDSHAVLAATSLLIATLLLPFVGIRSKLYIFTLIFSLATVAYVNGNYIRTTPESFSQNVIAAYRNALDGLHKRLSNHDFFEQQYKEALNAIHLKVPFPTLKGASDIYSHDQAYLLASSNTWSPRPAFQSYTAYTPRLDDLNRQHLEGMAAPNNIFISIEPIDQRLPSSEDGSSWPLLLSQYRPVKFIDHYLLLEKIRSIKSVNLQWGNPEIYRLTERVLLPKSIDSLRDPVYAKLIIKPTLLGRIKNVLYKSNLIHLDLEMIDGTKKPFRLVPGMAENGIMISPLVETTQEFNALYSRNSSLDKKRVKSFAVLQSSGLTSDWDNEYTVAFSHSTK